LVASCARATNGHAAAEPVTSVMNSRRLMGLTPAKGHGLSIAGSSVSGVHRNLCCNFSRRFSSLPPPALGKCCHNRLARLGIAVRRASILVVPEGQRPHPRHSYGRGVGLVGAADHDATRKHVEIVVVPFARRTRGQCAFEDQLWWARPISHGRDGLSKIKLLT
jgi:hypothetical protein